MSIMFEDGQMFQHKDGGIYQFIATVRYSDRPGEGVMYYHLWPFEAMSWVRPIEEWTEDRFKPILTSDAIKIMGMNKADGQEIVKANKAARK